MRRGDVGGVGGAGRWEEEEAFIGENMEESNLNNEGKSCRSKRHKMYPCEGTILSSCALHYHNSFLLDYRQQQTSHLTALSTLRDQHQRYIYTEKTKILGYIIYNCSTQVIYQLSTLPYSLQFVNRLNERFHHDVNSFFSPFSSRGHRSWNATIKWEPK
jgi:hypothetical protein